MDERTAVLDEAVRRFGEAWANGDVAVLESLLSPTYTHADAYGKSLDRAAWLDYAKRRTGRTTQIAFEELHIRIVGDIGIVTGINRLQGAGIRNATDSKDQSLRFTQVWISDAGCEKRSRRRRLSRNSTSSRDAASLLHPPATFCHDLCLDCIIGRIRLSKTTWDQRLPALHLWRFTARWNPG